MTGKYCVFLRGINVNGIRIKMQDLKVLFDEMGFTEVQTILATGNVIITEPERGNDRVGLKAMIEKGLNERFGYEAHIFLRDQKELIDISNHSKSYPIAENCHHYLLICDQKELPSELMEIYETMTHAANEQFNLLERDAFWVIPKGNTLDSVFGSKILGSKKFKSRLTSRNMNTIEKVIKVLEK